jgi:N,N'-diacetyllegionaminate synthase
MIGPIKIGKQEVGPGKPCYIIAEAGVNHNGRIEIAHKLIDVAVAAGADAVKFQMFRSDDLATPIAEKANYQVRNTGSTGRQIDVFKQLELSLEHHLELKRHSDEAGIEYCCTPYDVASAAHLIKMNVKVLKIASSDTTNIPFLRYLSKQNLPKILSTGMCSLGEVEVAVTSLRENGYNNDLVILHCTAEYPALLEETNLRAINTLQSAFACPVGFSDHTEGIGAGPWSVLLGACVLEKHFTLSKKMEGLDHRASLEPDELVELIKTVRLAEKAMGDGIKRVMPGEESNKKSIQKSIVAANDIQAGSLLKEDMLSCKRPGTGLSPMLLGLIIGAVAAVDIPKNTLLSFSHLRWE